MTYIEYRKLKHRCTQCNAELPEGWKGGRCAKCKEDLRVYLHNRYYDLKARGICTTCGFNPARPGKTTCMKCALKRSEFDEKVRQKKKAQ